MLALLIFLLQLVALHGQRPATDSTLIKKSLPSNDTELWRPSQSNLSSVYNSELRSVSNITPSIASQYSSIEPLTSIRLSKLTSSLSTNVPIVLQPTKTYNLESSFSDYNKSALSEHFAITTSATPITSTLTSELPNSESTVSPSINLIDSTEETPNPILDVTAPLRVSNKYSTSNGTIAEIIGGIIQLLGTEENTPKHASRVPHEKVTHSRKNDRGPPKIYPSKSLLSSHNTPVSVNNILPQPQMTNLSNSNEIQESFTSIEEVSFIPLTSIIGTFNVTEATTVNLYSSTSTNPLNLTDTTSISYFTPGSSEPLFSTPILELSELEEEDDDEEILISAANSESFSSIPNGPITDWVPLIDRPTLKSKQSSTSTASELSIITEPSVFNITVINSIGARTGTSKPRDFPSEQSTHSKLEPTVVPNRQINKSSDYTITEATEIEEVIITLLGSGTMKSQPAEISPSTVGPATGRPYVIPVEIEEVRPFIGAQIPTRPNSFSRPNNGHVQVAAAGINVADDNSGSNPSSSQNSRPSLIRPIRPRPTPPIIRIDTCIVGDDTTCDAKVNEYCKEEQGVSSCQCRPGFVRTFPRGPCHPVISILVSVRVDRIGDQKITFNRNYLDPGSQVYQQMEQEARHAINSLFSYTSFARQFFGTTINKFYPLGSKLIINSTIHLDESTKSTSLRQKIRKEMVKAISNKNQNIGESQLYADGPLNPVPAIEDLNECTNPDFNDCSLNGFCENAFGTFRCVCNPGYMDKHPDELRKSGRICSACSPDYCSSHGVCVIENGRRECKCRSNYIGSRCEIDGEVLGVAVGASLAAVVIIVLTLVCLCVWNRRWRREQQKVEMMSVPSMASYGNKPITPINTYRLTIEDRVRWAHIADAMGNGYMTTERPGRAHPNKQEREDNYYGHPGRPRSRMCHSNPPSNGHYNIDLPPRDTYHPPPNRFMSSNCARPYYN